MFQFFILKLNIKNAILLICERERERERVNKSIYPLTHEMLNLDNYIFLLKKCATWPNRKLLYQKFILIVKINKCKIMIDFSNLHQISVGCASYIYIYI